jgi:hypothetical protein
MARIKVVDIPKDKKLSPEELRKVIGGQDIKAFQRLTNPEDEILNPAGFPKQITIAGRHNIA